jgi:hypothetical protein
MRRREKEPEWGRSPPLQPRAVDKGARGGARDRRPRQSSGHRCMAEQLARAREASDRALFNRPPSLTGRPNIFLFIKVFKHPHFDIRIGELLAVQISPNFA